MALLLKAGDRFPDLTLSNEDGAATSLAQVADGRPLLLSFYRGPWWPASRGQLRELVQFHQTSEMRYCGFAAVSKDPPAVQAAFRHGLGAAFPFLCDAELRLTDALGIRESSDTTHGPLPVPFTFALHTDLTVHRLWSGWWFAALPTPEELRQALRELLRRSQPDFDFTGD